MKLDIEKEYTAYYDQREYTLVYPCEFVVRTFLAKYPELQMKKPDKEDTVIDISCGDGRNLLFLCQQGYNAFATEITPRICNNAKSRLERNGYYPDIRVGKNHRLPFDDSFTDYALAAYSMYYCDKDVVFSDILKEYGRVIKRGGWLIASVIHKDSKLLLGAEHLDDGTFVVRNDPYGNRNGYRLYAAASNDEIYEQFSPWFENFSFGRELNDFYGVDQNVFWVVCQKRNNPQ